MARIGKLGAVGMLAALALSACTGLPPANPVVRTPPELRRFEFDGRIAVRESQSWRYANISWRHAPDSDEILLTTPLGQGVAELRRDAAGARLLTADRKEFAAADWGGLTEQVFGARLPIDDLPAWLAGRAPDPATGWRVDYLDYQSDAADALPTLIEARRGDLELRLKIDAWSAAR